MAPTIFAPDYQRIAAPRRNHVTVQSWQANYSERTFHIALAIVRLWPKANTFLSGTW